MATATTSQANYPSSCVLLAPATAVAVATNVADYDYDNAPEGVLSELCYA